MIGTILLLALTVTLFSSIFLFVDGFPQPPPQPASQFSAHLLYNGSKISAISVLHLSGPTLSGSTILVYLYSSEHPTRFTSAFSLSSGLNGSKAWNLGQTWYLNLLPYTLTVGDNITVSIITTTQLLFRVTLPGNVVVLPPQFLQEGTDPAVPTVSEAFTLYVQILDPDLKSWSVYANVSAVPGSGLAASDKMSYSSSLGEYVLSFPSGGNAVGTYYVFVNASDNLSQHNTIAIPITIASGISSVPSSGVAVTVSPLPVVNGTAETIYAVIENTGASTSAVIATFYVGGTSLGSSSGSISGGGSTTLSKAWTPGTAGNFVLTVEANISGGGAPTGIFNVTVFPSLLFIAHNVVQGSRLSNNTSAYLAEQIQAAGFPFTSMFVACNVALPAATTLEAYDIVVIDYGSQTNGPCAATPSTTEQGKITSAMASPYFTGVLLVGADVWKSTTCSSYSSTFLQDFGITGTSGTCTATITSATSAVTYASSTAKDFLAAGIGTLTLNQTLAKSNGFLPAAYFSQGASNSYLTDGGHSVGAFQKVSGRGKGVVLATDPALLMTTLAAPASSAIGVDAGGTSVVYNALNYVAGFASSTSPGRSFADFAISGAQIYGTSASHLSSVYVTLRGNGATAGLVTVSLTVNGTVALFGGSPVSETVYVPANGGNVTLVLTWEAPTIGPYTLGVAATAVTSNLFASLAQLPMNVLNQATVFTA